MNEIVETSTVKPPHESFTDRVAASEAYRIEAAQFATKRALDALAQREDIHPEHRPDINYVEEKIGAADSFAMSFTKGLKHDKDTGLVSKPADFEAYRKAIVEGFVKRDDGDEPFTQEVPSTLEEGRPWEAPTAGQVFDLQGPDAQAVTMQKAPQLGDDELTLEMAEVYELALLRDVPFSAFREKQAGENGRKVDGSVTRLERLLDKGFRKRMMDASGRRLSAQNVFRGSSKGVDFGPYLSQFMLIGSRSLEQGKEEFGPLSGYINYGAQRIDQRVPVAQAGVNYMTDLESWIKVQDGGNVRDNGVLFDRSAQRRFMATPRDLATYVHDDALYQAYLNACLLLLSYGAPFDERFDALSGGRTEIPDPFTYRAAGGFALYGGPHILSLVTEVATRALKAVRYQKFNVHRRLRPEALAARMALLDNLENSVTEATFSKFSKMEGDLKPTLTEIRALNTNKSAFLPMAFQEGSPMHPAYGAGHATVAGACVTILKAFFNTDAVFFKKDGGLSIGAVENAAPMAFMASDDGSELVPDTGLSAPLTVGGELNKLAANISIGRNMGGVHYYSDYFDSIRMGEEIAIGLLKEQALGYPTDNFELTLEKFDGACEVISRDLVKLKKS